MKVVLASVTQVTPYSAQRRFLALGYVHASAMGDATVAANAEIVHNYYDSSRMDRAAIADRILAEKPRVVGFACYVWNTPDVLRVCEDIKKRDKDVVIILGGPEVSYHYKRILDERPYVDYVCCGEGEHTFREFMLGMLEGGGAALEGIAGLGQRKAGKAHLPAPRPYEKDLDKFPSPYVSGVLSTCEVRGGATYQTARGCPFVCTYCDYGRNQPYFEFSMERVRQEFEIFAKQGVRQLFNADPTFNYSRVRAEGILQIAIDLDLKSVHWIEVFPSLINDDLVELLQKSYATHVGLGIQTCNPKTMKNIRRVWKPEKVSAILDKLKNQDNIMMQLELIMGLPGDSLADFKSGLSWVYDRNPASTMIFPLAILPRTPMEREVAEGKWDLDFDHEVGHEITRTAHMSAEDVQVGRAIIDWHRLMTAMWSRLQKVVNEPAADLIEGWAWRMYHAGYHEYIGELRKNYADKMIVETLATNYRDYVAEACQRNDVRDVSGPMMEFARYCFFRQSHTWGAAHFSDVRDIYFNEPFASVHKVRSITSDALPAPLANWQELVPRFGTRVNVHEFNYDMLELYPAVQAEQLLALKKKPTIYAFFMDADTGAGNSLAIDATVRSFIDLVDGERTLMQIATAMTAAGVENADRLVPAVCAAFEEVRAFTPPRFMSDFEEDGADWAASLPKVTQSYLL